MIDVKIKRFSISQKIKQSINNFNIRIVLIINFMFLVQNKILIGIPNYMIIGMKLIHLIEQKQIHHKLYDND